MNRKLLAMLNDAEQALVREATPDQLAQLDEDELIELHTRIRRARNKYSKLYRRRAGERVKADSSRGRASAANACTRVKAEIFEDVLADVSRRLAAVAKGRAVRASLRAVGRSPWRGVRFPGAWFGRVLGEGRLVRSTEVQRQGHAAVPGPQEAGRVDPRCGQAPTGESRQPRLNRSPRASR